MINVLALPSTTGKLSVCIILGQDDVFLSSDQNPHPGVALTPDQAREIARRLIAIAEEVERLENR